MISVIEARNAAKNNNDTSVLNWTENMIRKAAPVIAIYVGNVAIEFTLNYPGMRWKEMLNRRTNARKTAYPVFMADPILPKISVKKTGLFFYPSPIY